MRGVSVCVCLIAFAVLVGCGPAVETEDPGSTTGTAPTGSTTMGPSSVGDGSAPDSDEGTTEDPPPLVKGEVNEAALLRGVTVNLQPRGELGEVIVPLATPLPDVPDEELQAAMLDSVALVVTSPRTLASADLSAAMVSAALSQPGAFEWNVNGDRDAVQFLFVNETPAGLVLTPGDDYVVQLQISTNDYVEKLPPIQFTATAQ